AGDGLAASSVRRGDLHLLLEQFGPAAADIQKSLDLSRYVLDHYGSQSAYVETRGYTYLAQGRLLAAQGKADDAQETFKIAVKVMRIGLNKDPDNVHHRRGLDQPERGAAPR